MMLKEEVNKNQGAGTDLVHRRDYITLPERDSDRLLDVSKVAEILSVSERTVWRWRNQKLIPTGITIGRVVRWSYRTIMDWIAARSSAAVDQERSV